MTQAVNLANFANNLDSSGGVSPSALNGAVSVSKGGTNATTAADARTNLGLGSIATQSASSVSITGGTITGITDITVADGGTGASTASGARTNLGVPANDGTGATGTWAINVTGTAANGGVTSVNSKTGDVQSVLTQGTSVAASGTNIDITGIPSWVRRITVMFNDVGTDFATPANYLVQIGDSGGIETSGYISYSCRMGTSGIAGGGNQTTGFAIGYSAGANVGISGQMIISSFGSNTWAESAFFSTNSGGDGRPSGGIKTLSGTLDRIRITTVGGTDTYTNGTINILYE
jgi:hypothetical protein